MQITPRQGGVRPIQHATRRALPWLVLLIVVALGLRVVQPGEVAELLQRARLGPLVAAAVLRVALLPVDVWVQRRLVAALGTSVSQGDFLRLELAAMPIKLVSPAKAGELLKPAWLWRKRELAPSLGAALVAAYKLLSLSGTLLAIGVGLVFGQVSVRPARWLGVAILGVAVILPVALGRLPIPTGAARLARLGRRIATGLAALRGTALLAVWLPMCAVQLGQLVVSALCFQAVGVELNLLDFLAFYGAARIAGSLQITPGGVGTREAIAVWLMDGWLAYPAIIAGSLLATVVVQALPAVLGLPLVPRVVRELESP